MQNPIGENELWLLSFYRTSELSGALFFGRLARALRAGPIQRDLTHHFADESQHAWYWTRCIAELGDAARPVPGVLALVREVVCQIALDRPRPERSREPAEKERTGELRGPVEAQEPKLVFANRVLHRISDLRTDCDRQV